MTAAAAAEEPGRREAAPVVPAPGPEAVVDGRPGMAFMEKPPAGKVLLDDTVPLTAAIEASQSLQSHTVRGPPGGPGPREAGKRGRGRSGGRRPRPGGLRVAVVLGLGLGPQRSLRSGRGGRRPQGQRAGGARRCPGGTPNWGCCWGPGPTLGRRGKQTTQDPLIHFCPPPAFSLGPRSFPPFRWDLSGGMRVCRAKCKQDSGAARWASGAEAPGSAAPAGSGAWPWPRRGETAGAVWGPAEAGVCMCSFPALTCYLVGSGSIHVSLKSTGVA